MFLFFFNDVFVQKRLWVFLCCFRSETAFGFSELKAKLQMVHIRHSCFLRWKQSRCAHADHSKSKFMTEIRTGHTEHGGCPFQEEFFGSLLRNPLKWTIDKVERRLYIWRMSERNSKKKLYSMFLLIIFTSLIISWLFRFLLIVNFQARFFAFWFTNRLASVFNFCTSIILDN